MGILDEDVARVREQTDFIQVASQHLALKRVGRQWVGLCPFHAEKTPSFSINAEAGVWYCFGCQMKGDVITFVREVEHLDFVGAVERLAALSGIELRYDDAKESRDHQRRSRLHDAMEAAVEWYHQRLLSGPDAAPARGYLRSRGYDGDVVRQFRIGWAPDDWDALSRALKLPEDVLRDTGLGFVNKARKQQDAFRARIMFPIFDPSGKAVAFGGRRLAEGEGPKYKNSQETPIYSKSRILYGLNWAKTDVVKAGEVIVCEGYTDVIGLFGVGLPRAVATCGTALADEHFRILKNFARRVVLAYDADAAGQAAAERFYEWEQRYEIDLAVAALPAGSDPGDLAKDDPDRLRAAVEGARPFLEFRVERVLGAAELGTAEGRARAARTAMAAVLEHPSALVRDQYVMTIADRTRIEPDRLREMKPGPVEDRPARPAPVASAAAARPVGPETEALRLLLHEPEAAAEKLHESLFDDELHLAAYRALADAATIHEAIENADPGAATLLQRLAVEDTAADIDDVVALLAMGRAKQVMAELEADGRQSGAFEEYAPILGWLKLVIEDLHPDRDLSTRVDASGRLVAWLAERAETR